MPTQARYHANSMRKGKSAAFMRALRRKYGLGEFSRRRKGSKKRASSRSYRRNRSGERPALAPVATRLARVSVGAGAGVGVGAHAYAPGRPQRGEGLGGNGSGSNSRGFQERSRRSI